MDKTELAAPTESKRERETERNPGALDTYYHMLPAECFKKQIKKLIET